MVNVSGRPRSHIRAFSRGRNRIPVRILMSILTKILLFMMVEALALQPWAQDKTLWNPFKGRDQPCLSKTWNAGRFTVSDVYR